MTLNEALDRVPDLNDDEVIFAIRPWTLQSDAEIGKLDSDHGVPRNYSDRGLEYFLGVLAAKELLSDLAGYGITQGDSNVLLLSYGANAADQKQNLLDRTDPDNQRRSLLQSEIVPGDKFRGFGKAFGIILITAAIAPFAVGGLGLLLTPFLVGLVIIYFVFPILMGAYPFVFAGDQNSPISFDPLNLLLTLIQWLVIASMFALCGKHLTTRLQIIGAIITVAVAAVLGHVVFAMLGIKINPPVSACNQLRKHHRVRKR